MRGFLLLPLLAAALAGAAGTPDGRAGPTVEPAPPVPAALQHDPRLEAKVTLRVVRRPLSEVLAAVGKAAEVTVRAAVPVADEPAIAWLTDRPAREVMQHLALLFNYRWMRTGEHGKWRYELFQDQQAKAEEEALRGGAEKRALEDVLRRVRLDLSLLSRSPEDLLQQSEQARERVRRFYAPQERMNADQLRALQQSEEYQRQASRMREQGEMAAACMRMAQPVPRVLARIAAGLTREQWQLLLDEELISFSTQSEPGTFRLSSSLASELRAARPSMAEARLGAPPEEQRGLDEVERDFQQPWEQAQAIRVEFSLERRVAEGAARACWAAQPTLLLPDRSQARAHSYYGGWRHEVNELSPVPGDRGPVELGQPDRIPPEWASDPQLGMKRLLDLETPPDPWAVHFQAYDTDGKSLWLPKRWVRDLLPQIARTYDLNLVADAYLQDGMGNTRRPTTAGEEPLYRALNSRVLRTSRWSRRGEIFHVRSYTWYVERAAQIPQRVAQRWASHFRRRPQLSLDMAAELALSLKDEQLERFDQAMREQGVWIGRPFAHFITGSDAVPGSGFSAGQRAMLRAYGSMTAAQRQALQRGASIPYPSLSPTARRWVRRALRRGDPMVLDDVTLALQAQPVERVAREENGSLWLFYLRPGAPRRLSTRRGPGIFEETYYRDDIPLVPGLVTPPEGESPELTFRLRAPNAPEAAFRILLPYVPRRALEPPAARPG